MTNTQLPVTVPTVSSAQSWLKTHETIIITILILIVSYFVLDKSLSIVQSWEQHKANEAAQTLANDKAKADADLAQAKQALSQYQAVLSQNEKINAQLVANIQSRDNLLAAQQKTDATLPPSQLGQRWVGLVGDSGIQPNTSGFAVSDTAALATVSKLEQVPVLTQDLKDEQTKSANLQKDVDNANGLISDGKNTITAMQQQEQAQTKACDAKVAAVKAEARKGKLKAFGIGYVLGYISGRVSHAFGF